MTTSLLVNCCSCLEHDESERGYDQHELDRLYGRTRLPDGSVKYEECRCDSCDPKLNGEMWLWEMIRPKVSLLVDVGVRDELSYPDDGRVIQHCFEPDPFVCRHALKYQNDHVFINNVGLGSKQGSMPYYGHSASIYPRECYGCKENCSCKRTVAVMTLDQYCTANNVQHIDFIKVDTEGFELQVLQGADKILHETDMVQFEYGGCYPDAGITLSQVYAYLQEHGFKYFYFICSNYLVHCCRAVENLQYCNYLATKKPAHVALEVPTEKRDELSKTLTRMSV